MTLLHIRHAVSTSCAVRHISALMEQLTGPQAGQDEASYRTQDEIRRVKQTQTDVGPRTSRLVPFFRF